MKDIRKNKYDKYVIQENSTAVVRPNRNTIMFKNLFFIAWKNILNKKLRSFLTVFGIVIGIGAISFLLSFGLGIQLLVTDQVIGENSIKTIDVTSTNSKVIKLDNTARNKLAELPHVKSIGVQYQFPAVLSIGGGEIDTAAYGIDQTFQSLSQLEIIEGRLLKNDDNKSVVISKSALDAIGIQDAKTAIGKSVKLSIPLQIYDEKTNDIKDKFQIVGVVNAGESREVFLPSGIFDVAGVSSYKLLKIIADDTSNIPNLRKQVESRSFITTSPIDTLDQINQLFKVFNILLIGLGSIGMVVAILGMFNTLTIALLERTKEIGLMKTLGGRKKDMLLLFMIEALLLSVIGASIGILLSVLLGKAANYILNNTRDLSETYNLFSIPAWLVVGLIIFMVCIGLSVVYFPARRAQKINPIDALRRE
jgi:putative ABC transport system permease protein